MPLSYSLSKATCPSGAWAGGKGSGELGVESGIATSHECEAKFKSPGPIGRGCLGWRTSRWEGVSWAGRGERHSHLP